MNKPIGISWEELREEILPSEEIAASNERIRALEGLQQTREGKTKDFNEVCERLETKYDYLDLWQNQYNPKPDLYTKCLII